MNADTKNPAIYQLHLMLLDISPSIWRRVLVLADSTIADLHAVMQLTVGWTDTHLNSFFIYGDKYGVYHSGGPTFSMPSDTPLSHFQFRTGDRFRYDYDFGDDWQHQIRIEKILPFKPARHYPVCVGGRRYCPPEDIGGPDAYMAYQEGGGAGELFERLERELEYPDDFELDPFRDDCLDVLKAMDKVPFDRRAVNAKLRRYAAGEPLWELVEPLGK